MTEPTTMTSADDTLATTQTWFGGTGNFSNPENWSPPGPPANSDTLIIAAGRAIADDLTITNPLVRLGSPTTTPALVLRNVTLAASDTIAVQTTTFDTSEPDVSAQMRVADTVTEDGKISVGALGLPPIPFGVFPAHLTINMAAGSTFAMDPGAVWVSAFRSTLTVNAPEHSAQFINNGEIEAQGGAVTINAPVTGQGMFDVAIDFTKTDMGALEFTEGVGAGQTISLPGGLLKLDEPEEFHASVINFNGFAGSRIELANTEVTSAQYLNGTLTLFDHTQVAASFNVATNSSEPLTTQLFAIFNRGGNAFINLETPRVQTWFGGTSDFSNPQNWSPFFGSLPATNDVTINAGQAVADDLVITNPTIQLGSSQQAPTLVLDDTRLAASTVINVDTTTFDPSQPDVSAQINVAGAVTEDGAIAVGTTGTDVNQHFPAHLTVAMTKNSTLTMDPGAIWFSRDGSTLDVNAPEHAAQFINNGDIEAFGGTVRMDVAVTGQGTFDVVFNNNQIRPGTLEFTEDVGAGQTIKLDAGTLKLDEPREFHGTIEDFNANSSIELADTTITSAAFANGVLTLFDNHRVEARLDFAGNFTTDQFAIDNREGNAFITLAPPATASAQDASGGTGASLAGSAQGSPAASDSGQATNLALLSQYAAAGIVAAGPDHSSGATPIPLSAVTEPAWLAQPQP